MIPEQTVLAVACGDPPGETLHFDAQLAGPTDGPRVLLLHGWPETADCWHAVLPALADAGARVVAVTQRGYSAGARPEGLPAYSLTALAADVEGFLDSLGWDTAHLVGHDWGAALGWAVAAARPDRVSTLTALSIPHPGAFAAALAASPEQQRLSAYIDLLRAPGEVAEQVLLRDDGAALRGVFTGAVPDDVVDGYVRALCEPGAMTAVLSWYRAMRASEWAAVGDVAVPTTYVWGTRRRRSEP